MEEKEEEITIDLGKLKDIFAGSKKEKPKEHHKTEQKLHSETKKTEHKPVIQASDQEEEEVSLDLSKLTSLFKPGKEPEKTLREPEEATDESEVSLDFGKIKSFFSAINPKSLILLLVLIPLILGIYIRLETLDIHGTDVWAQNTVKNYYVNSITSQINQQYPTLPDSKKGELVKKQYDLLMANQKPQIDEQISGLSERFKEEFRNDKGENYLPDIDTYYWLRFIENVVKHGHPGDTLVNGTPYDTHFVAPIGRPVPEGEYFHIYLGYYFYKALNLVNNNMTPMMAFAYLPVFLFVFCVIFTYLIARRIGGDVGGFFASLMLAVTPYFVIKTAAGYADTDIQVVFFPLLITWLFLEAYESKKLTKTILLSALAGLVVGLYSFTWGGWWYIFDFLLAAGGLYLVYYFVRHKDTVLSGKSRHTIYELLALLMVFAFVSSFFVIVFTNFDNFAAFYRSPLWFRNIKTVAYNSIWPNVYTTVAEQNEISLSALIDKLGGILLFSIACVGVLLSLLKKDKNGYLDPKYAFLLIIWFISTLYASTKGVRYILVIIPAFSIAFGTFVGTSIKYLSDFLSKEMELKREYGVVALTLLFLFLLLAPVNQAVYETRNAFPEINDAWVRSLDAIKTNTSEDAIINSWWDFGHWFKYWADRRVTFDGTSQQSPQAHWIGRALLTGDEDEAIALLRMLDCGGNNAYDKVDSVLQDPLKSVNLVKRVIMQDRKTAKKLLVEAGITNQSAEEVLLYTHCQPPEDYFITSEDMVSKSGVWAHFGAWNFTRADMVLSVRTGTEEEIKEGLIERFNVSPQQVGKIYYEIKISDPNQWIAPWPSYMRLPDSSQSRYVANCINTTEFVSCENGIKFNLTSQIAYVDAQTGKSYPKTLAFIDNKNVFRNIPMNGTMLTTGDGQELSSAIIFDETAYYSVLMTPELAPSIFTRLFYFNDNSLKHFKLFHYDRDVTGQRIFVWKVDWEAK